MPAYPRPAARAFTALLVAAVPVLSSAEPLARSAAEASRFVVSFNAGRGEQVEISLASSRAPNPGTRPMTIELRFLGSDGSAGSPTPSGPGDRHVVVIPPGGFATVRVSAVPDSASRTATLRVDTGGGPRGGPALPVWSDLRVVGHTVLSCLAGCGSSPLDATIVTVGEDGGTLSTVVVLSINAIRDRPRD
jgi:hypothetical protein